MKVANLVARFLKESGVRRVFCISGGASLHLIHGLKDEAIPYTCPQHEATAGFCADAVSRLGGLGCAIATSGPGATNLVTAIASSYYDSIPVLYITGQVVTFRMSGDSGCRQIGFQETPIVQMVKGVTKYAVTVMDKQDVLYELQKALHIARSGRPGPVLIDIPDDIQRQDVDEDFCKRFMDRQRTSDLDLSQQVMDVLFEIRKSKRPVMVCGWGVRLSNAIEDAFEFSRATGIPIAPTWAMKDMAPYFYGGLTETFGTHGTRAGNLAVQNADLILSVGSRLDTKATGTPKEWFARGARMIMVDIDPAEIEKHKPRATGVVSDAKEFLQMAVRGAKFSKFPDFLEWREKVRDWKQKFPIFQKEYGTEEQVNPYAFYRSLTHRMRPGETIVSDTGCALGWAMQGLDLNRNRFLHCFNQTPMGCGLGLAIGAAFHTGGPVTLLTGDGSIQMSIGELATIAKHDLPIKIIVFNNRGHGMCRQTERQWLNGVHCATSEDDLAVPKFAEIALAYGFRAKYLDQNNDVFQTLTNFYALQGPGLLEVEINPDQQIVPQARFGAPNEDAEPRLPREVLEKEMLVELVA